MRVFLTGANGWIGSVIARELLDAGHSVVGLVRSREKGEALVAAGVTPLIGGLHDLDVIRAGASDADGISTPRLASTGRGSSNWRTRSASRSRPSVPCSPVRTGQSSSPAVCL